MDLSSKNLGLACKDLNGRIISLKNGKNCIAYIDDSLSFDMISTVADKYDMDIVVIMARNGQDFDVLNLSADDLLLQTGVDSDNFDYYGKDDAENYMDNQRALADGMEDDDADEFIKKSQIVCEAIKQLHDWEVMRTTTDGVDYYEPIRRYTTLMYDDNKCYMIALINKED